MNDPNGCFQHQGVFHLFYQYSAEAPTHRAISWGHATSWDMVHWRHLPVAIRRTTSDWVYSGNALVDRENRSGLQKGNQPPCLAFFTNSRRSRTRAQHQTVDLAFSTDGGWHWQRYGSNPLADPGRHVFDAPYVFRFPGDGDYRMLVGERLGGLTGPPGRFSIYRSRNLLHWERVGQIGPFGRRSEVWEVPVLVPMRVGGRRHWVLIWSVVDRTRAGWTGTRYLVGAFDGTRFVPLHHEDKGRVFDFGADVYAPLVWSHVAGPPIVIAWMSDWNYAARIPTTGAFTGGPLTVPRELRLVKTRSGTMLSQAPIRALRVLRGPRLRAVNLRIEAEPTALPAPPAAFDCFELEIRFRSRAARFGVLIHGAPGEVTELGYDTRAHMLYIDRTRSGVVGFARRFPTVLKAPVGPGEVPATLRVFVDRSSIELFGARGTRAITAQVYPRGGHRRVELFVEGGRATATYSFWPLRSIWRSSES